MGVGAQGVDIEMRRRRGTRSRFSCIPCAQWAKQANGIRVRCTVGVNGV